MTPKILKRRRNTTFRPTKSKRVETPPADNVHQFTQSGIFRTAKELSVRFSEPSFPAGYQDVDLSEWLAWSELGELFAGYLAWWGTQRSPSTRAAFPKLVSIFGNYLTSRVSEGSARILRVSGITTEVVSGYEKWLDDQLSKAGRPWADLTKSIRYDVLSRVIDWSRAEAKFARKVSSTLHVRPNPWPGRHRQVQSHEALSIPDLDAIRAACIEEVRSTLEDLKWGNEAVTDPAVPLPLPGEKSVAAFKDVRVCIKAFATYFPRGLPPRSTIRSAYPGLVRALVGPDHLPEQIGRHLYFTARTIVPFIVLVGIDYVYNSGTILSLLWEQIEDSHPIFGNDRWCVAAKKGGSGLQRRSFPSKPVDPTSTVNLLRALKQYTATIRQHLPLPFRDRVFVFWQPWGAPFRAFGQGCDPTEDALWSRQLRRFIAENGLPRFTLASLRATGSDVVHRVTGGDLKAQQLILAHASAATTERHYQSGAAKRRRREELAAGMQWQERYIGTAGKADTRDGRLRDGRNTAATPGFACAEPTSSPQPGQRQGRMCTAYGKCPGCPLALADTKNPAAFIRILQLRDRIIEARSRIQPQRWLKEWQPELVAIDRIWLPKFSEGVRTRARSITLPSIPEVE